MRALIVEDDQFHAAYLQEALAEALPEVTEIYHASDGAVGEEEARSGEIDAIVMDLQMDKRNGIEAARTIWAERPHSRILFWSNYADEAYFRGVAQIVPEDSAYGYILKTASRERLKLSLRAVFIEGQIMVDREVHRFQQRASTPRETLTDSEYNVLVDLALGITDKAIAERRAMSLRSVQNRLVSLYQKLGVEEDDGGTINKRTRAIHRALITRTLNVETLVSEGTALEAWYRAQSSPAKPSTRQTG